jgi:hypothetical protein
LNDAAPQKGRGIFNDGYLFRMELKKSHFDRNYFALGA